MTDNDAAIIHPRLPSELSPLPTYTTSDCWHNTRHVTLKHLPIWLDILVPQVRYLLFSTVRFSTLAIPTSLHLSREGGREGGRESLHKALFLHLFTVVSPSATCLQYPSLNSPVQISSSAHPHSTFPRKPAVLYYTRSNT